jgi:type II secretory pathway component GspD/PulD (secretin)
VAEARETGLPVIARRTATNRVRVQDGGTAAIAGLTESRSTLSYRKTPGFSGIPLIGKLFDRTKEEMASQEIAIFITARLVPDTPGGSTPMPEPVRTKREGQMSDKEFRDNLKQSLISLDQQ